MGHRDLDLDHHHDDHVDDDSPDHHLEHDHLIEHDHGTDMDHDDDTTGDDDLDNVLTDLIALHDIDYWRWHRLINAAPDDVRSAYWRRAIAGHWC